MADDQQETVFLRPIHTYEHNFGLLLLLLLLPNFCLCNLPPNQIKSPFIIVFLIVAPAPPSTEYYYLFGQQNL